MKILFVTMQYGRAYGQGTERYLATLGACLRERGHEVAVLAGDPLRLDRRRHGLGEAVVSTGNLYALTARGWMAVQGTSPRRLARILASHRPDVVHLANPAHVGIGVSKACRRLNIPLIVTTMDFWWICPKATLLRPDGRICPGSRPWSECISCIAKSHTGGVSRLAARLPARAAGLILASLYAKAALRGMPLSDVFRWTSRTAELSDVLSAAAAVIFPSRATAEVIQPCLGHHRWRLIPYGLSSEWFASARPVITTARPPEALTIGFAGALQPHKGPHLLLEAVRRLGWTKTRVRLAGPAGDESYLSGLRERSVGLNVEFVGVVRPDDMPAFLRSLDVLAMTSLWPENLPFVVLEAQAAGVPVVAGRMAGVADQVGDDRLLFEPGSVAAIADALGFAARNPGEIHLGTVSTAEEMTACTEAVYAEAVRAQPLH